MPTSISLGPNEARVIGCLIEKAITTPDQYPLSLNALVNACNQKNNRDPVVDWSEDDVQRVLADLERARLVAKQSGFGSRVVKYQQRFCNTEFGTLKFDAQALAVVCELLLRGAQMPGELRSRASRMAAFRDVEELEAALEQLAARSDGPFVARLAREPGRRESRYMHLFSGDAPPPAVADGPNEGRAAVAVVARARDDQLAQLSAEVAELRDQVAALRAEMSAQRDELAAWRSATGQV